MQKTTQLDQQQLDQQTKNNDIVDTETKPTESNPTETKPRLIAPKPTEVPLPITGRQMKGNARYARKRQFNADTQLLEYTMTTKEHQYAYSFFSVIPTSYYPWQTTMYTPHNTQINTPPLNDNNDNIDNIDTLQTSHSHFHGRLFNHRPHDITHASHVNSSTVSSQQNKRSKKMEINYILN